MGLPDRKGDALVREIRSIYPLLLIVIASGQGKDRLHGLFEEMKSVALREQAVHGRPALRALRAIGIY
jgi:hypothetical protein